MLVQWHGFASFCSAPFRLMRPEAPITVDDDAPSRMLSAQLSNHLLWFFHLRYEAPTIIAYETLSKAIFPVFQGRVQKLRDSLEEDREGFNEWYYVLLRLGSAITVELDYSNAAIIEGAVQTLTESSKAHEYFKKNAVRGWPRRGGIFLFRHAGS